MEDEIETSSKLEITQIADGIQSMDINDLLSVIEKDTKNIEKSFHAIESNTTQSVGQVTSGLIRYMELLGESTDRIVENSHSAMAQQKELIHKCVAMYTELGHLDHVHDELTLIKSALERLEARVASQKRQS